MQFLWANIANSKQSLKCLNTHTCSNVRNNNNNKNSQIHQFATIRMRTILNSRLEFEIIALKIFRYFREKRKYNDIIHTKPCAAHNRITFICIHIIHYINHRTTICVCRKCRKFVVHAIYFFRNKNPIIGDILPTNSLFLLLIIILFRFIRIEIWWFAHSWVLCHSILRSPSIVNCSECDTCAKA